jgi:hypothetical protein
VPRQRERASRLRQDVLVRRVHERYDGTAHVEPQGRQLRKCGQRSVRGMLRSVAVIQAVPLRRLRVVGDGTTSCGPFEVAQRILVRLVVPDRVRRSSAAGASELPIQVPFSDCFWCHCESLEI